MSLPRFILASFGTGIWVMLRLIPVLILMAIALIGPFFATENFWVRGAVVVLASTVGAAFYYVTGIRAGLMALRQTDTPDFDGLVKATLRQMFVFAILQFIVVILLFCALGAVYYWFVLPAVMPEAWAAASAETGGARWGLMTMIEFLFPEVAGGGEVALGGHNGVAIGFLLASTAIVALGTALFGVPMAANAANAVQKSPQHDLIYGFGSSFSGIFAVAFLANAAPSMIAEFGLGTWLSDQEAVYETLAESGADSLTTAPAEEATEPATAPARIAINDAAGKTLVAPAGGTAGTPTEDAPDTAPTETPAPLPTAAEVAAAGAAPLATILGVLGAMMLAGLYLQCTIFAAIALGYRERRAALLAERQAESRPVFDPNEHKEEVRSLRQMRQQGGGMSSVYVPERYRTSDPSPAEPSEGQA